MEQHLILRMHFGSRLAWILSETALGYLTELQLQLAPQPCNKNLPNSGITLFGLPETVTGLGEVLEKKE